MALAALVAQAAFDGSAGFTTSQGDALYKQGNFNEAINKYDQALVDAPEALELKFNKAKRLYDRALLNYENIISEGQIQNSKLFYNLANANFLKEDLGRAIFNYRRPRSWTERMQTYKRISPWRAAEELTRWMSRFMPGQNSS